MRLTKPATENVPVAVTRLRFRFLASCMMARSEGPRNGVSDAHPRHLDQSGLFGHKSVSSICIEPMATVKGAIALSSRKLRTYSLACTTYVLLEILLGRDVIR